MLFELVFRSTDQRLDLAFEKTKSSFDVALNSSNKGFDVGFERIEVVSILEDGEFYEGAYSVTPAVTAQKLETAKKFMTEDVEINQIPYFDVSNISGGRTVYIGSEV